jgi:hypothetical protein
MNFGFLIFPGMEELDLVGPWEKISLWSKFTQGPEKCFMVAENPDPVICERDMSSIGFSPGTGWRRHTQRGG